jgi:hypothetical protein
MSRVLTAALRFFYILFGLGWAALAVVSAVRHQNSEAIVYGVVAAAWITVVLWITLLPSRWWRG